MTKTATKTTPQQKSLSEYIQERFDEFSRSQKDVARYIVDHLDEAAFLTAEELARRASTSSSTVVRFSQALGFEGYPELQQAAIEEYRNTIATAGSAAAGNGALFSFDHSELEGSLGADHANLEETARNLTREQVDGAVAALAEAQRIVIVGVDQMAFFASYLRHTLSLLDIRSEIVASTGGESLQRLGRIDDETLVIVLSSGRAHPLLLRAMKLALHRSANTPGDLRRLDVRGRRARRTDPLLLLQQPLLRPLQHGADGAGPGARLRALRPRRSGPQRPHPRLQTEVARRAGGGSSQRGTPLGRACERRAGPAVTSDVLGPPSDHAPRRRRVRRELSAGSQSCGRGPT